MILYSFVVIFLSDKTSYCKHYLWASTEVFVDWRKQRISYLMMFFLPNFDHLVIVYIKMIIDFKNFLLAFPWRPHDPGHKANHKGVEKYIFHCFGDECFPKWDFEKLTTVSITRCQSLYLYTCRDLLASLLKFGLTYRSGWPLILTLTLLRGWWGRCEKNYLRKEEGREGGEKSARSAAAGPGARTRDLPRARRGSPAARQGGCLDKQAFPCL